MQLNKSSSEPAYLQIYRHLRRQILTGQLLPGARLPASRRLAREYGVARVTVTQAYEQLQAEGYVIGRPGAGTFVSDQLPPPLLPSAHAFEPKFSEWGQRVLGADQDTAQAVAGRPPIDFGFGRSFPHIFPYDVWRRLLARYLSTDDIMLSRYGSVAGFYPLRQALAEYLGRLRGVNCTPEQVIIVSGAQQALDILGRLLLTADDQVLVETPGYANAFELFAVHGARLLPLPVDDQGFPVERIPVTNCARLVFVTPSNQFPKGGTMPLGAGWHCYTGRALRTHW